MWLHFISVAFKRFANVSMFLAPPMSVFQILTNPLVSLTNIVHRIFRCSTVTDKNGEAHNFCLKNNLPYKDSQCCIYGILIIDKQKQVHKVWLNLLTCEIFRVKLKNVCWLQNLTTCSIFPTVQYKETVILTLWGGRSTWYWRCPW